MTDTSKERHPFRFLFKFMMIAGVLAAIGKVVASKSKDFYGMTESEARAKFESKLGPRIGEDKAAEVADQVIPRLKEKGVIKSDAEKAVEEAKEAAADATEVIVDTAEEAGASVEEAVEKVGKNID